MMFLGDTADLDTSVIDFFQQDESWLKALCLPQHLIRFREKAEKR